MGPANLINSTLISSSSAALPFFISLRVAIISSCDTSLFISMSCSPGISAPSTLSLCGSSSPCSLSLKDSLTASPIASVSNSMSPSLFLIADIFIFPFLFGLIISQKDLLVIFFLILIILHFPTLFFLSSLSFTSSSLLKSINCSSSSSPTPSSSIFFFHFLFVANPLITSLDNSIVLAFPADLPFVGDAFSIAVLMILFRCVVKS